jgi:hypothetical protein
MAAEEVIYFPFWAQLFDSAIFPTLPLPEPIAKPPPSLKNSTEIVPCGDIPRRAAIRSQLTS